VHRSTTQSNLLKRVAGITAALFVLALTFGGSVFLTASLVRDADVRDLRIDHKAEAAAAAEIPGARITSIQRMNECSCIVRLDDGRALQFTGIGGLLVDLGGASYEEIED
jgi:hypothetical protein